MAKSDALLALAARMIGYHEEADKRNLFGAWYAVEVSSPGMNGLPWCMMFVQWCYAKTGIPLPYRTASCGELLRWYRKNQPECVAQEPVPGCIVIFDFPGGAATDHTGLFVSKTKDSITTIDGNTSGTNQSNGGWVQQKTRRLSYARPTYIVPRELVGHNVSGVSGADKTADKAAEEDEEMQKEKRYDTVDDIKKECPWAVDTVSKLMGKGYLNGDGTGLNLTRDMLRMFVINDRAGLYE